MIRHAFLILAAMCLASDVAHAASGGLNRTASGENVTINLTSPYSDLPPGGCLPYQIKVDNDRDSAGTWRIYFNASGSYSSMGTSYYEEKVSVPAHTSSIFNVLVPLPIVDERGNAYITLGTTGPGFDGSAAQFGNVYCSASASPIPYAAYSDTVLGKSLTGPLESLCKDRGQAFYGTAIDHGQLPADWRGYTGLVRLLLTDTDWLDLGAQQKQAVLDWLAQGGRLSILATDVSDARIATLQLPTANAKPGPYGFGTLSVESVSSLPAEAEFLSTATHRDPAAGTQGTDAEFSTWGLRDGVGTIILHGGFILCFVFAFGILVGPVNLFVFARGTKRFRLFWTTPLISIAASLALIAGILLTDGLGGHGKRLTAIFSMPESNREAVVQEQIARTAVLFSNRWHGDEATLVSPITDDVLDGTVRTRNAYYRARAARPDASGDTYNKTGNDYSGHWFRSRSMVGQYLQTVRPTRSSITVINPTGLDPQFGHAAEILSSYPQTLSEVFLIGKDGRYWHAQNVEPGHKTTLVESQQPRYASFWADACKDAGGKLRPLLHDTGGRSGNFYAVAEAAPGQILPTLNEIHWDDAPTIYLGPWVAGTNAEKAP